MKSFTAAVVDVRDRGGEVEAALDATAFYPGGGGQPPDAGHLGDRVVREAVEEDGTIWHRLDGSAAGPPAGMRIEGRLDWARRFDFMQQHTGQHILSRAFVDVAGADTKSFHLGEAAVTIDVEHAAPGRDLLERVEARANEVVWEDRPVSATWTTRAKAARLPLRKAPDVEGAVRIVEVEGFDWSACGGTHVASAGQVGLIHVLGTEKVKQGTRVSFLCGGRVLRRLRDAGSLLRGLALEFTAGEADLPRAVARLKEERAALDRRLRPLLREALDREAAALAA